MEWWSEFSFVLKLSAITGVVVFATHNISAGALLIKRGHKIRVLKMSQVPKDLLVYCLYISNEECVASEWFDGLEIGWYINHADEPNIEHGRDIQKIIEQVKKDSVCEIESSFIPIKDIKAGEEILINYDSFEEPTHLKDDFYRIA